MNIQQNSKDQISQDGFLKTYPNLILTIERFETPKYKNEKWSVLVGNDNADVRHVVPHNPGEEQIKPKQIQQVPQKKRKFKRNNFETPLEAWKMRPGNSERENLTVTLPNILLPSDAIFPATKLRSP